jgi:hypothetical protein
VVGNVEGKVMKKEKLESKEWKEHQQSNGKRNSRVLRDTSKKDDWEERRDKATGWQRCRREGYILSSVVLLYFRSRLGISLCLSEEPVHYVRASVSFLKDWILMTMAPRSGKRGLIGMAGIVATDERTD